MRKILTILLISIFPKIFCFSQTTYPRIISDSLIVITSSQLKQTNLIFAEHQKLKSLNIQLDSKYTIQEEISSILNQSTIVKDLQITNLQAINNINKTTLLNTNKELSQYKKRQNILVIGGCTIGASLTLLLLFK
ncbi:hypothetical protein [Intestinibacter sp.]|uniref:hypothetical protein n=1 Tax=Intestinibacter sp. TaxID=1965304 RepID=UPI003F13D19C